MAFVRRLPFTLFMELAIIVVALTHNVVLGDLRLAVELRWGFGPQNLRDGRLYTLVTAPFFVRNLRMFLGILLFVGYSVGIYEWVAGTRRALLLYWSTNIGVWTLAAALIAVWLSSTTTPQGHSLMLLTDVGPSVGGMGCVGGWVNQLPRRYRPWAFFGLLAYLAGKLALNPEPFADTAHLIVFPVGFALDHLLWHRPDCIAKREAR